MKRIDTGAKGISYLGQAFWHFGVTQEGER